MSAKIVGIKNVTTRKPHECWGCARGFPDGSRMTKVDVAEEGKLSAVYWCEVCQAYSEKFLRPGDECARGELRIKDGVHWGELRMEVEDGRA